MTDNSDTRAVVLSRLPRWVEAGLITAEQSSAIAGFETGHRPPEQPAPRQQSLLSEALAYVGGAVIVAAAVVLAFGYWDAMNTVGQYAILSGAFIGLLVAGTVIPVTRGVTFSRIRGVLWLLSSVALLLLLLHYTEQQKIGSASAMIIVSVGVAAYSVVLWIIHRAVTQHIATFAGVELVALALVERAGGNDTGPTTALIVAAFAWAVIGQMGLLPGTGRWLPPAHSASRAAAAGSPHAAGPASAQWDVGAAGRRVATILAAVGALVGTVIIAAMGDWGLLALLPIAATTGAAVILTDLAVLGISAAGTLIVVPLVFSDYTDSILGTALAMVVVGGALVGLGVLIARLKRERETASPV